MTHQEPLNRHEKDLFDVLDVVWQGREILAGFVVVAMALGAVFLALNKPEYVTQATYEINPVPPFLEKDEIQADISRIFFSADTFAQWKEGRPGTSLNVDLIDEQEIIDGVSFGKSEEGRFVIFRGSLIKIQSNDTQLIFEVLDYFEFVGLVLSERYFVEAKREFGRLNKLDRQLFAKLSSNDALIALENIAGLDRFLERTADGIQIILISRPLPPQKISVANHLVITIAIILGVVSGAFFLLLKHAYRLRKLRLADLEA